MAFKLLKTKISLGSMPPDPPSGAHWKFSTIRWWSNILLSSIKGKFHYLWTIVSLNIAAGSIVYVYNHVYFIFRYLSELTICYILYLYLKAATESSGSFGGECTRCMLSFETCNFSFSKELKKNAGTFFSGLMSLL